jgi:hypothetical protein
MRGVAFCWDITRKAQKNKIHVFLQKHHAQREKKEGGGSAGRFI